MKRLKQSTAKTFRIGPFLDETDGVAPESGLTIAYTDIMLSKDGAAFSAKAETTAAVYDSNGYYAIVLGTSDTDTVGFLDVSINISGALPVFETYLVQPANVYDSFIAGTDYIQADTVQVEGLDATDQINAACDTALIDYDAATGTELDAKITSLNNFDPTSDIVAHVTLVDTVTTNTDMRGTDSAALETTAQAILADTGTDIPALIAALNNFDPTSESVSLGSILGTSLSETAAGYLAAALSHFFDVASASKTVNDVGVSGSGLSAADVWEYATRTLTAGTKDAEIDTILADTAEIANLNNFNPTTDIVSHVTLVDTVSTNTDMRGTDGAVTSLSGISTFDPSLETVTTDSASREASKADISSLALEASVQGAITNIATMQTDITEILGYTNGDWEITTNNQMIFKNESGVEIGRFNLTKVGVPDSDSPDKRERV